MTKKYKKLPAVWPDPFVETDPNWFRELYKNTHEMALEQVMLRKDSDSAMSRFLAIRSRFINEQCGCLGQAGNTELYMSVIGRVYALEACINANMDKLIASDLLKYDPANPNLQQINEGLIEAAGILTPVSLDEMLTFNLEELIETALARNAARD